MIHNSTQVYKLLKWDSSFFGFKVALIYGSSNNLSEILHQLEANKVKLAYCFISDKDRKANNNALKKGGLLVDRKVTYRGLIGSEELPPVNTDKIKSFLFKPLNDKILSLALQSGIYSRFCLDKHFASDAYEKLYSEWISKSLAKIIADEVYMYVEEGKEQGLITLSRKDNYAEIGLLAVDTMSRGKSLGKQLVNAASVKTSEWGYNTLKVATQKENIPACRFYEKLGFEIEKIENIYHFWL